MSNSKPKKFKGMYFTIKFIDYACYKDIEDRQKATESRPNISKPSSSKDKDVRDILNRDLLINPDCPMGIIRDYVSDVAGLKNIKFDIASDRAKILQTVDAIPSTCGLEYFKVKELYYIVLHKPREKGTNSNQIYDFPFIPLLNPYSKEYAEFCSYQKKRSSITSRRSSSSNKSSKDSDTVRSSVSGRKSISKSAK